MNYSTIRSINSKSKILKIKQVIAITSLSRSTIYRYMESKMFPMSVKLGAGRVGWTVQSINQFIASREFVSWSDK